MELLDTETDPGDWTYKNNANEFQYHGVRQITDHERLK